MSKRAPFDHYRGEHPERWATEQLVDRLPALRDEWGGWDDERRARPARILEPCHGTGNISGTLARLCPEATIITNDLDERHAADYHVDACDWALYGERPDWIISNPPFDKIARLVPHFVREARYGVALILPINYREPRPDRAVFLAENPPAACWDFLRISWTGDGKTGMHHCAWFVWTSTPLGVHHNAPIVLPAAGARLEGIE